MNAKRLALALSVQAEIEGMKVENTERENHGFAAAHNIDSFYEKAEELRVIASKHEDQL
jgi:hypothetical protein